MLDALPNQKGLKRKGFFIAIALQLYFRLCYQEGSRKSERTGTEQNTSAPGVC